MQELLCTYARGRIAASDFNLFADNQIKTTLQGFFPLAFPWDQKLPDNHKQLLYQFNMNVHVVIYELSEIHR